MVSKTNQTQTIRARKAQKAGRARKNKLANHGSTLPQDELFKLKKD
jgi:hypothetical protein